MFWLIGSLYIVLYIALIHTAYVGNLAHWMLLGHAPVCFAAVFI